MSDEKTIEINSNVKHLSKMDFKTYIQDTQLCFQQELILINGKNTDKPIIATMGVTTCVVCIIHDPIRKITVFTHVSDAVDISTLRKRLDAQIDGLQLDLTRIQVIIAGGWKSLPSSKQYAEKLREYWREKKIKNLDCTLLLKRDCFSLDVNLLNDFIKKQKNYNEIFKCINCLIKNIDGLLYPVPEEINIPVPILKKIADLIIELLNKENGLKFSVTDLVRIQVDNQGEGVCKIIIHINSNKSNYPILGFNTVGSNVLVVDDDCSDIIQNLIQIQRLEERCINSLQQDNSCISEIEDSFVKKELQKTNIISPQPSSILPQSEIKQQNNDKTSFCSEDKPYEIEPQLLEYLNKVLGEVFRGNFEKSIRCVCEQGDSGNKWAKFNFKGENEKEWYKAKLKKAELEHKFEPDVNKPDRFNMFINLEDLEKKLKKENDAICSTLPVLSS